jgi:uncharacterized protein YrrD
MMMGRDLCGLPVFSWVKGSYLGRVADFFIDNDEKSLSGISLGKTFSGKRILWVDEKKILKIYKDGVIIASPTDLKKIRNVGNDHVSYNDFTRSAQIFLKEGETVSDLVFDPHYAISGYEISGGLWKDLADGRKFYPRCDKVGQISK